MFLSLHEFHFERTGPYKDRSVQSELVKLSKNIAIGGNENPEVSDQGNFFERKGNIYNSYFFVFSFNLLFVFFFVVFVFFIFFAFLFFGFMPC